jgi:putative ABC transport system permease protein
MLVARSSVNAKIEEVKAQTATQITINPAGVQGGMGEGDPLSSEQVEKIKSTTHISSAVSTLSSQLSSDNTTLESALEGGRFRIMGQSNSGGASDSTSTTQGSNSQPAQTPPIVVTGMTDPSTSIAKDTLTSGEMIDGTGTDNVALIGKTLAEKNNLSAGDTFTMYGETITIKGIYSTDNRFRDSGITMPLGTLQAVTDQTGEVSSVLATVDSSDNVASTVEALKTALGDDADITSQEEQAESSLAPLESIANLALGGVITATIAGAVIVLLAMIMIVRERRREIGVIKAIGGTSGGIIAQFVSEALTLTIIGGVVGLAIGIAASGPITQSLITNQSESSQGTRTARSAGGQGPMMMSGGPVGAIGNQLRTNVTSVTSTVTPQTFALSAGMILLIAVFGSAIPAWLIARIRPAEVLRAE